jgi:hypothetical protein
MKQTRVTVLGAVAAVLFSGCGTIANFAHGDPEVFGGVQNDVAFFLSPGSRWCPLTVAQRGG